MQGMYSMRSPAVKRLMKEAQELSQPTEQYFAQPLEDNLFEWHFTLRGPGDSEFEDGIYHGRIILPPDYPMKPPSIILLTPNGRFDINKKICLSISGHHPESWQPSWSIRTALLAIIGFMPTHGAGAIGSLDYPVEERKKLAKKSQDWNCSTCGNINNILKPVTEASQKTTQEAKELASQINFQGEKEKKDSESSTGQSSNTQQSNSQTPKATSQSPQANQPASTQLPQGFPQYQFNRFPYPSPFMQFPGFPQNIQPGNNTSNSVPRFPPPPPFIPAMFPPGFMTNAGQGVQNPGMCMDANWYQNLTNTGQPSRVSQSSSGPPVSSIGVSSSSPVSRFSSVSSTSGVSSSSPVASVSPVSSTPGVSSSSPVPSVSPVSSTSGMSSSSPVSRVSSVSSETSVSTSTRPEPATVTRTRSIRTEQTESSQSTDVNTASSGTVPSQGNDSVTEGPSGQNTNTVIQNTGNPSNDNSTSLRQRAPATGTSQNSSPAGTQRTVPTGGIGHSAELRDHSRRTGISFSTFLIVLISLAIAILLIRRFLLSRNWKFHYGM